MKKRDSEARLAKLLALASNLNEEINAINANKRRNANRKLVGKCFKVKNTYGSDSEPWWLYVAYTKGGLNLTQFRFELTTHDVAEIQIDRFGYPPHDGYIPITKEEFAAAWDFMMARMRRSYP